MTSAAYADGTPPSELRTAETARYLQYTRPKLGQRMHNSWEGLVLVETPGTVRAGRLVRAIGSFECVGTDKECPSKLTRIFLKALKGLYCATAFTAESLERLPQEPSFWRGTSISEDIPSERQQPSQHGTELRGASQRSPSRGWHACGGPASDRGRGHARPKKM